MTKARIARAGTSAGFPVTLGVLAIGGHITTVVLAFPGHSNFDEMYSLNELWAGRLSDVHPPLQTVVWSVLFKLGSELGLPDIWQAATLLLIQSAIFWISAWVLAKHLKTKWLAVVLLVALAVCPVSLIHIGGIGKDSQLAVALITAIVLMFSALRSKSIWFLAVAVAPLFYAFSVRSNGPVAVAPLCLAWGAALLSVFPSTAAGRWQKRAWSAGVAGCLFLSLMGANWAFYRSVVSNPCCIGSTGLVSAEYDFMGISFYANQNVVPPFLYSRPDYSLEIIKELYQPLYFNANGLIVAGPDLASEVMRAWFAAVTAHPEAFLQHRKAVLSRMLGFDAQPPQPYGFGFFEWDLVAKTERMQSLVRSLHALGPNYWAFHTWLEKQFSVTPYWPIFRFWIYSLAALIAFIIVRPKRWLDPSVCFAASAVMYLLPYVAVSAAAAFRYLFWCALALFLATVLRIDDGVSRRGRKNDNASQAAVP
jgi:hypothetical protein